MSSSFISLRTATHRLLTLWGVLVLVLTWFQRAEAQAPTDSVDLFLSAKMRQLRILGLQLATVRQGRVVKSAQYGLANIRDSIPVGRNTRFSINSITKAFMGVAMMQLVEAGKLASRRPCRATWRGCRRRGSPSRFGSCSRTRLACPKS